MAVTTDECDEFSLLDRITGSIDEPSRCEEKKTRRKKSARKSGTQKCPSCEQELVERKNGSLTCTSCGEESQNQKLEYDQEWRYISKGSNVRNSGRCQFRIKIESGIYHDVDGMGFNQAIVEQANSLYKEVTNGAIYRGARRRAIVFACIFHAFKLSAEAPALCTQQRGDSVSNAFSTLTNTFGITQKAALQGLKFVKLNSSKTSPIHTTSMTVATLVEGMLNQFGVPYEERSELFQICRDIENKSSRLNRSRPQSVAAGVIFFWICKRKKSVKIDDFGRFAGLSELTIYKLAKEIGSLLGQEDIVDKRKWRMSGEPSKRRRKRPPKK